MLDQLKEFYQMFSFLGVTDITSLIRINRFRQVKAGEVLVNAGDMNYNFFIVLRGMLRNHIVMSNGDERTVFLATEGMISGAPKSAFLNEETNEAIMAIEDSVIAILDGKRLNDLVDKNPRIQRFYLESLKKNLIEAIGRIEFHTVMTPEERYKQLMETRPELVLRVPVKHLASFIGITPVSLSRIRSRLG